jgi:porin
MVRRWTLGVAAAMSLVGGVAAAQQQGAVRTPTNPQESPEEVVKEAEIPTKDAATDFDLSLYTDWQNIKQNISQKTGIDFALEFTAIYQQTTGGIPANYAMVDTTGLFATWAIFRDPNGLDKAGIGFQAEARNNPLEHSFTEMTNDIGSLWAPNDSTSNAYAKINQLWWGQRAFENKLAYQIGKIDPGANINQNRFAGSGNTQFFSQPFATNPARAFPDNGLGVMGRLELIKNWYVAGVMSDSEAISTYSPFKTIEGFWFYGAETGVRFNSSLGEGNYRLLYWYRDTEEAGTGHGWALSFDQDLGDLFGVFLRYGGNDGDLIPVQNIVATGISLQHPFGRKNDQTGIAVSWTNPSDGALRDEWSSEIYYRMQLTQFMEISASAQVIFNPSAGAVDTVGVFGGRLRLLF